MRSRRWRVHVAWGAVAVVCAAVTWWAASVILHPAVAQPEEPPPPLYTVAEGRVGVEADAQGQVLFPVERTVVAGRSGVVTEVFFAADTPVEAGERLLTIDLAPVVAAPGATPAFRDMALDMQGADIAQLRAFLGLEDGDLFDWQTEDAVRSWQRELGMTADGVVRRGDLAFLPTLPARVSLAAEVGVGDVVDPGAPLLLVSGAPDILVHADPNGRLIPGLTAQVGLPDGGVVRGVLGESARQPDGLEYLRLLPEEEGRAVCDEACAAQFPVTTGSQVPVRVELVPVVEGLVVPDSALVALPDGGTGVRTGDGEIRPVTVVQRGQGTSIVEGVDAGVVIELFADPDASS